MGNRKGAKLVRLLPAKFCPCLGPLSPVQEDTRQPQNCWRAQAGVVRWQARTSGNEPSPSRLQVLLFRSLPLSPVPSPLGFRISVGPRNSHFGIHRQARSCRSSWVAFGQPRAGSRRKTIGSMLPSRAAAADLEWPVADGSVTNHWRAAPRCIEFVRTARLRTGSSRCERAGQFGGQQPEPGLDVHAGALIEFRHP